MAKGKGKRTGRSNKETSVLKRLFGDLEIVDADNDVLVPWTAKNLKKASRKDPGNCVIAYGCKEFFGSSVVAIFKTRAYMDILGDDGVRRVLRFFIPPRTRAIIEAFDRGDAVPDDGRQVVLKAPSPARRLDYQLKQKRKWRKAVASGKIKPGKGYSTPRGDIHEVEVRDGRGLWHITPEAA